MRENQCPYCGYVKTDFDHQQLRIVSLEAENSTLKSIIEQLQLALTIRQSTTITN